MNYFSVMHLCCHLCFMLEVGSLYLPGIRYLASFLWFVRVISDLSEDLQERSWRRFAANGNRLPEDEWKSISNQANVCWRRNFGRDRKAYKRKTGRDFE